MLSVFTGVGIGVAKPLCNGLTDLKALRLRKALLRLSARRREAIVLNAESTERLCCSREVEASETLSLIYPVRLLHPITAVDVVR